MPNTSNTALRRWAFTNVEVTTLRLATGILRGSCEVTAPVRHRPHGAFRSRSEPQRIAPGEKAECLDELNGVVGSRFPNSRGDSDLRLHQTPGHDLGGVLCSSVLPFEMRAFPRLEVAEPQELVAHIVGEPIGPVVPSVNQLGQQAAPNVVRQSRTLVERDLVAAHPQHALAHPTGLGVVVEDDGHGRQLDAGLVEPAQRPPHVLDVIVRQRLDGDDRRLGLCGGLVVCYERVRLKADGQGQSGGGEGCGFHTATVRPVP